MKTTANPIIKATSVTLVLLASLSLTGCYAGAPESVRSGDGVENSSTNRNLAVFTLAYGEVETDYTLQSQYDAPGGIECDFENKRVRNADTITDPLGGDLVHSTVVVHGRTVDCIYYNAWDQPGGVDCDYAGNPVKK